MGAIGYGQDIYPTGSATAKDSVFDNTGTDLESTNAEDAIKEVDGKVEELSSNLTLTFKIITVTVTIENGIVTFIYPTGVSYANPIMDVRCVDSAGSIVHNPKFATAYSYQSNGAIAFTNVPTEFSGYNCYVDIAVANT